MTGLYGVVVVNPFVMSVPAWAQMLTTALPVLVVAVAFAALGASPRQRMVGIAMFVATVLVLSSFGHAVYLDEKCVTLEQSWWAILAPWCW